MKLSGSLPVCFAAFGLALNLCAAPDHLGRDATVRPAADLARPVSRPEADRVTLGRRIDVRSVARSPAASDGWRFPIAVTEVREKKIFRPGAPLLRPGVRPPELSPLNRRPAHLSPAADARSLPLAAKYQGRFPADQIVTFGRTTVRDRAGAARLNRFVFRPNPSAPPPAPRSTPSAGGPPAEGR